MIADRKAWKTAGLFMNYHDQAWDTKTGDLDAYEETLTFIDHLAENRRAGRGVVFLGPPGRGKTLLAHLVADAALGLKMRVRCLTMVGYQHLLLNAISYMNLVNKAGDLDAVDAWWVNKRLQDKIRGGFDWVLLDDLGKEHTTTTGFIEHQFDRVIRARGNNGLPTIITTNIPLTAWAEAYGESMASYIKQVCQRIYVDGIDHRAGD